MRNAAIFDLDGTLITETSAEKVFFLHLLRRGGLTPWNLLQMLGVLWKFRFNFHAMVRGNKRYLRNKKVDKLENVARSYFEPRIDEMIFPRMREVIDAHRQAGDLLLLLSGTLDIVGNCFIRHLNFDGGKAGVLEQKDGRFTGRIEGILPYGLGKLEVLRELRRIYNFDQNHTTLYANIYSDRYVMNAVETPVAVNPDTKLRAYALRREWRIIEVD